MDRKKLIPIISAGIIVILVISLIVIFLPTGGPTTGARKAIILSSANDFQKSEGEPDFNDGEDAKFYSEPFPPKWIENFSSNTYGGIDSSIPGHNTPGVVQIIVLVLLRPNMLMRSSYSIGQNFIHYMNLRRIIFRPGLILQLT